LGVLAHPAIDRAHEERAWPSQVIDVRQQQHFADGLGQRATGEHTGAHFRDDVVPEEGFG
jgi:hypothetical protein